MAIIFTVASQEAARHRTKDKLCGNRLRRELSSLANKSKPVNIAPRAESDAKSKDDRDSSQ